MGKPPLSTACSLGIPPIEAQRLHSIEGRTASAGRHLPRKPACALADVRAHSKLQGHLDASIRGQELPRQKKGPSFAPPMRERKRDCPGRT